MDYISLLSKTFQSNSSKELLLTQDDKSISYASFWLNAEKLADKWQKAGVKQGETIVFIFPNDVSMLCCLLSCAIGGFVACPIVHNLHQDTISNMIASVNPKLIIYEKQQLDETLLPDKAYNFYIGVKAAKPFLFNFTSGLTGEPKTMCHSLDALIGSAYSFGKLSGMTASTRLYHILPMAYMAGIMNTFLAPLMAGGTIIEGPLFSPSNATDFWTRPINKQINTLSIVPSIAASLIALTRDHDTIAIVKSQITQIQCTSAPISKDIKIKFKQKFSIPLQDCYGITELGGPLTFQHLEDANAFSDASIPIPQLDISLRNDGELWIKSPFAMLGYYQNKKLDKPVDEDGFMNTGDTAVFEDGKISITGRKKDIIIRGGVNVSPLRIETSLSLIPSVEDVAVVGLEHSFWGEEIVAVIVTDQERTSVKQEIVSYAATHLAAHERPDKIVFVNALPRSFVGKVQKNYLKKLIMENKQHDFISLKMD